MKKIITFWIVLILILTAACGGIGASAEESGGRAFDSTPVLEDLTSSTDANGNHFDLTDYPYQEYGEIRLITLTEYCYSYAANQRDNYGIYLYLYNPTGREIDTESELNVARLAVSYNESGGADDYEDFSLKFCSRSTGDYNNLFYKFRIEDHESADGKTIGERVNSNLRRYDLSGVELVFAGDDLAQAYGCGGTYKYSGYAAGYGPDAQSESTLKCEVTDLDTLELDIVPTQYRPAGVYNGGHQDQLNSVYFAVPNDVLERYGRQITEIKARWDEYKTGLIGVFDDKSAYDIFSPYVGKDMEQDSSLKYALIGNYNYVSIPPLGGASESGDWKYPQSDYVPGISTKIYNLLTAAFYTDGQEAETYTITSERMEQALKEYSASADGEKINGVYSADLFVDYVDEGHTRGQNVRKISSETEYSLTSQELDKDFWYYFLGIKNYENTTYNGIKAIEEVDYSEVSGSDAETISKNLYIDASDVASFKEYCRNADLTDKTVFIFRFSVTDYYATSMSMRDPGEIPATECGYGAQQTVFLDFNIIQVTFYKEGVYTVIPVVSDPVDIVPGVTPPLPDPELTNWGEVVVRLIAYAVLLFIIFAVVIVGAVLISGLIRSRQSVTVAVSPPKGMDGQGKTTSQKKPPAKSGSAKQKTTGRKYTSQKKKGAKRKKK